MNNNKVLSQSARLICMTNYLYFKHLAKSYKAPTRWRRVFEYSVLLVVLVWTLLQSYDLNGGRGRWRGDERTVAPDTPMLVDALFSWLFVDLPRCTRGHAVFLHRTAS